MKSRKIQKDHEGSYINDFWSWVSKNKFLVAFVVTLIFAILVFIGADQKATSSQGSTQSDSHIEVFENINVSINYSEYFLKAKCYDVSTGDYVEEIHYLDIKDDLRLPTYGRCCNYVKPDSIGCYSFMPAYLDGDCLFLLELGRESEFIHRQSVYKNHFYEEICKLEYQIEGSKQLNTIYLKQVS